MEIFEKFLTVAQDIYKQDFYDTFCDAMNKHAGIGLQLSQAYLESPVGRKYLNIDSFFLKRSEDGIDRLYYKTASGRESGAVTVLTLFAHKHNFIFTLPFAIDYATYKRAEFLSFFQLVFVAAMEKLSYSFCSLLNKGVEPYRNTPMFTSRDIEYNVNRFYRYLEKMKDSDYYDSFLIAINDFLNNEKEAIKDIMNSIFNSTFEKSVVRVEPHCSKSNKSTLYMDGWLFEDFDISIDKGTSVSFMDKNQGNHIISFNDFKKPSISRSIHSKSIELIRDFPFDSYEITFDELKAVSFHGKIEHNEFELLIFKINYIIERFGLDCLEDCALKIVKKEDKNK